MVLGRPLEIALDLQRDGAPVTVRIRPRPPAARAAA